LENWVNRVNWEALLNKSSTSWRQLTDHQKTDLTQQTAIDLMFAFPTLIKRPVLDSGEKLLLGFKPEWYAAHFITDSTFDLTDE
jgi:arsenate reductase-like glutaredoxin family protein